MASLIIAVYATALSIAQMRFSVPHAEVIALALTLDLVVVIPLAFYLLLVRRLGWPQLSVAPVFVISLLAAAKVLPANQQQLLHFFEILAFPIELGLIGFIVWRARQAVIKAEWKSNADPLEQLRNAALDLIGNETVAGIIASEIAVLYYAFGSWKARAQVPESSNAFTHHRRSGYGAIVCAFLFIMTAEGLAVHMLLSKWHTLVAWIFTFINAYGMLWLIADYRATVLRPILISESGLIIRAGLRCTLLVEFQQLAQVTQAKPELGRDSLNLTLLGTPTHWLTFTEPMLARSIYGLSRRVRAIGIEFDEPLEFERLIEAKSR